MISLLLPLTCLLTLATSQSPATKRGLAYIGDTHAPDNQLLTSSKSLISWYYTWSLYTTKALPDTTAFVPLAHAVADAQGSSLRTQLNSLPAASTRLLSFNEPDGTTSSGGSSISPEDAAKAYVENLVPLRTDKDRAWKISHPSVTGSGRGLDWLKKFNESCYKLDPKGCPTDFVAVHWYGDFAGLAAWLGTLHSFYNPSNSTAGPKLWVTEMALPQADKDATLAMMKQALPYLDGVDYVEAYAWFGAFRSSEANAWTGSSVSLFDGDGGLTDLGALYLGGQDRGFSPGTKGQGANGASTLDTVTLWLTAFTVLMVLFW